jgi:photosystem II stability/assembly factor-like uncharacterized protein
MRRFKSIVFCFVVISLSLFAQQDERTTQPQFTRDHSLFPLRSTGIWTEVHPLIPRVIYFGIHFANANLGWAVGEGGAIIKTTNGGQKWNWVESGVENALKTIYSVNNGQRVIAAGDGGVILISDDAGETWNTLPSAATSNLWNMQMINEEIGWIVGEGSAALKTTDGGLTWIQQQMPHTNLPYWDVSFVNLNYGYIAGNSAIILKTTNGGTDWQIQIAGDNRSLFTVYAYDSLKVVAGGFAGKIVVTTDGGSNWQQINTMTANVNRIKFLDSLYGFAVTSGSNYQTTDGGFTWTRRQDIQHTGITWNIGFSDLQNGYIAGSRMFLMKTTDAGVSWEKTIINDDFINVYFKDEQNGFINSSKIIYTTNDGGYTLDTLETFPYTPVDEFNGLLFIDSLTGFISYGTIYKTINGGEDWYATNGTGGVRKIFFINTTIGWAIGGSTIYKTTDAGENWFVQATSPTGNFSSIHFVDSLFGWASIVGKKPFKTTNGGNNWIEQTQLSPNFSRDVFFIDTLRGFIVESGEFYQTSDGGNTFFLNTQVNGFVFARFSDFENQNIFLTGYKVYHSINDGETLDDFQEVQGQWLIYTDLLNVMTGYAVGNVGLIFKYFDESVPVELTVFSAELFDNAILLTWETATEINNQGFEIQRSANKTDWEIIGFVQGKGTSTAPQSYLFEDTSIERQLYYYRLKQLDFDGSYVYSDIIEVKISLNSFELFQNYPNPANPVTIIKYIVPIESLIKLSLYDITGAKISTLVNERKQPGRYEVTFNAGNLSSGVYFYRITAGDYVNTKKLLLLK